MILYPRSKRRHSATAGRHSAPSAEASFDEVSVISFKGAQAGVEILAFRNDDDVESRRDLVPTKYLSNQSFSPVSLNRAAYFSRRRDPEPSHARFPGQDEHRAVAAVEANAPLVYLLEFRPAADM